ALDRLGKLALLLGRDRGDAARHDLAALGQEALQQLDVLVVDLGRVGRRERARFAPTKNGRRPPPAPKPRPPSAAAPAPPPLEGLPLIPGLLHAVRDLRAGDGRRRG